MFQVFTANVTSIIFEILDFLFKIMMAVFETLTKMFQIANFQNCFFFMFISGVIVMFHL